MSVQTTNELIPGDVVIVKYNHDDEHPDIAHYLGPREGGSKGYIFQNSGGVWEQGKTGFDRKSCQDLVVMVVRDGKEYRYHASDWGPLWIR